VEGLGAVAALNKGYAVEVDRGLVSVKFGRCSAEFWTGSSKLLGFSIERYGLTATQNDISDVAIKGAAEAFLDDLRTPAERWTTEVLQGEEGKTQFRFRATVAGRVSDLVVLMAMDNELGTLSHMSVHGWFDYSKYASSAVVRKELAMSRAADAYFRYAPFHSSRVMSDQLVVGVPRRHADPQRMAIDWLPEHADFNQSQTAIPLYRIHVVDAGGTLMQWIEVDARTGRALSIILTGTLSTGTNAGSPALPKSLDAHVGATGGAISLTRRDNTAKEEPTGERIGITYHEVLLNAVLSEDYRSIWLLDGEEWREYSVKGASKESLKKAVTEQTKPFGTKG
jgi:hypothetical protein